MLDAELSKIEKPAGIANPKDFRNEVVKFALRARAKKGGRNPAWTSYEKLREVIEKRMFSQVEDLLPVISFGTKKTERPISSTSNSSSAWSSAATPSARCAGWSSGTCASTRPANARPAIRPMRHFIDRRLNPKDKNLGNRQRFMRRARAQIKYVVDRSIKDRSIALADAGETVRIPTKSIGEPIFHHAATGGGRSTVLPGNTEFVAGDRIPKCFLGGEGPGGKRASDSGDGEDAFEFTLTREEFLDVFFENLELPNLVKISLKETHATKPRRAGYTASGTATNINVLRTMRNSFDRRLALKRPKAGAAEAIEMEIAALAECDDLDAGEARKLAALRDEVEALQRRRRLVPYIDPMDIRYNRFEPQPQPNTKAFMFCVMDVSGSMGEREKDLAKRFFILLHLLLRRRYERIDVVFIRHTHVAQEVDEDAFFYSRETGGTVVSTALVELERIIDERYPPNSWNIYAAQASDGDNYAGDAGKCTSLLDSVLLPLCQYYAYVEILDEREMDLFRNTENGTALWRAYRTVQKSWPNFAMKRIARPGDIYPVFRELFARQTKSS